MENNKLKIYLAAPRGFCAGVDRAIEIVKKSLDKYGAPVYVRHEIVHNKHVVESLKEIGAVLIFDEIKFSANPLITIPIITGTDTTKAIFNAIPVIVISDDICSGPN